MNDLAALFGISSKDVANSKKDAKGKNKGKTGNKEKKEKKPIRQGERYPLPVRVRSGHIQCTLTQEQFNGKTLDENEIKVELRKLYPELSGIQFSLVKFSNEFTRLQETMEKLAEDADTDAEEEFLKDQTAEEEPLDIAEAVPEDEYEDEAEGADAEQSNESDLEEGNTETDESPNDKKTDETTSQSKGCWVKLDMQYQEVKKDQSLAFPVTVKVGKFELEIKEEISLEEIRTAWVEEHPEYAGCHFCYDERNSLLFPYMLGEAEIKGKKYNLPVQIGYLDQQETYTCEDFGNKLLEYVSLEEIRKAYGKKHPEYENAVFVYNAEKNLLFPVLEFKKSVGNERVSLPILVRGSGFSMQVEKEDLKGAESATLEEIRAVIECIYPEFSKERTEMIYDERNFVIPVLKGSRKGIQIIIERKNQGFYVVQGRDGFMYRIEQMPYGCFDCREDGSDVDFRMTQKKIPYDILLDVVAFFKRNPFKEAAVQIFYDVKERNYEIYYPEQKVTSASVVFTRSHDMENDKVLVMDIHSHGAMKAFFSSVDDHDEKGTRLFMVFGNLDKENITHRLRAGIAGNYKMLKLSDVFEMEDKTNEK